MEYRYYPLDAATRIARKELTMSEKQEQLKRLAEKIYLDSEQCEDRRGANYYRRRELSKIPIKERWMVKEYVRRIGKARSNNASREAYRHEYIIAMDKKQ